MKLLLDQNIPRGWLTELRAAGHEVYLWSDIGPRGADDDTICRWAFGNACVVLTFDLDFGTILQATGAVGPSVLILRARDGRVERSGSQLLAVLDKFRLHLELGALVILDHDRQRVRLLPLSR